MRLGVEHTGKTLDCARALASAGIASLVIHARTRAEGYRPPAHWDWVARIREVVDVPVIANGEVWTVDDYARCRVVSGCEDVMLGRGAVADPFLARRIRGESLNEAAAWAELQPLLAVFWRQVQKRVVSAHAPGRLKLWLNSLRRTFAAAEALYGAIRPLRCIAEVECELVRHGVPLTEDCRAG